MKFRPADISRLCHHNLGALFSTFVSVWVLVWMGPMKFPCVDISRLCHHNKNVLCHHNLDSLKAFTGPNLTIHSFHTYVSFALLSVWPSSIYPSIVWPYLNTYCIVSFGMCIWDWFVSHSHSGLTDKSQSSQGWLDSRLSQYAQLTDRHPILMSL